MWTTKKREGPMKVETVRVEFKEGNLAGKGKFLINVSDYKAKPERYTLVDAGAATSPKVSRSSRR